MIQTLAQCARTHSRKQRALVGPRCHSRRRSGSDSLSRDVRGALRSLAASRRTSIAKSNIGTKELREIKSMWATVAPPSGGDLGAVVEAFLVRGRGHGDHVLGVGNADGPERTTGAGWK